MFCTSLFADNLLIVREKSIPIVLCAYPSSSYGYRYFNWLICLLIAVAEQYITKRRVIFVAYEVLTTHISQGD